MRRKKLEREEERYKVVIILYSVTYEKMGKDPHNVQVVRMQQI
jgi:hypothetical protein